jgi:hypothetical protein
MLDNCNAVRRQGNRRWRSLARLFGGLVGGSAFVLPATLLLGSPSASAQVLGPGAPPGTVVAVQGTDNGVWIKANLPLNPNYANVNPDAWTSLGGQVIGPPAVVDVGGEPYYIAVGTDNALWVRTLETNWNSFAPSFCYDSPGAVYDRATTTLYVGCRGGDDSLWVASTPLTPGQISFPSVTWTDYGGVLGAGPAVGLSSDSSPEYLAEAPNGQVWYHAASVDSGWVGTNANCVDTHLAADYDVALFESIGACRGVDGQAWWGSAFFPTPFNTPEGGALIGGPGIAVNSSSFPVSSPPYLFAEGTDGAVWVHEAKTPTYEWFSMGGQVLNGVEADGGYPLPS